MKRRAVVTGIGLVTPLAPGREASWRRLIAGESAASESRARVALPTEGPRAPALAIRAAQEAWTDAGLPPLEPERLGNAVSGSKPILWGGENGAPLSYLPPEAVNHAVAREMKAGGLSVNLSAACATGAQSLLVAAGWIGEGRVDAALAGAAESSFHPLYEAGFQQMGVLSKAGKTRPFDRARDGFVLGEGAAVFIVEEREAAARRGAQIYGEITGGDLSCDAHHATRFNSAGQRMAGCLARALARAGTAPRELDYINAHGTATPLNDSLEALAISSLFPGLRPAVSSTKGATGHLLGATGAVELAFALLALRDGLLPPTLGLEDPETEKIDFIPDAGRAAAVRRVASLSFGFGGALAAVVAERPR